MLDAGSLAISEFMAANQQTLPDLDGDYSDWIEIHNRGPETVDTGGWYLTDDPDDLDKWALPQHAMPVGDYLLIFASGKDRRNPVAELHANFKLDRNGEYLALVEPDGETIASQFAPEYPDQYTDVSYGSAQDVTVTRFVSADTPANVLIPHDDSSGTAWRDGNPFDASAWLDGTASIGFDTEGSASTENIAMLGTASQSSDYSGSYPASLAIDGDTTNFTHTANQEDSYWRLDFLESKSIGTIVLLNRASCCAERLSNFRVSVFDASMTEVFGEDYFTPAQGGGNVGLGDSVTIELPSGTAGKTVQVQLIGQNNQGNGYLSLAEVEIYETKGYHGLFETDLLADMRRVNSSAYVRIPFDVAEPIGLDALSLNVQYDDGFVAYLNGQEVARRNAPAALPFSATAVEDRPDTEAVAVEKIHLGEYLDVLRSGDNLLAIHALNYRADDSDFLLIAELEGLTIEPLAERYFTDPTPGDVNAEGILGFVSDTRFSHHRGFFDEPFEVTITTDTADAVIRYTTDGTKPTDTNGSQYAGPIAVDTTTTLRAAAFKTGYEPTNVDTQSYIFLDDVLRQPANPAGLPSTWDGRAQNPIIADYAMDARVVNDRAYSDEILDGLRSIPTISIVMDPADLFGSERGIYINSAQRGITWEHPTSVEIIEPDGSSFQVDSGIRIHGYSWRNHSNSPKHSFRLEFRDEYGPVKLEYPLFPDSPVDKFDSIVLRAQGGRAWAGLQVPAQAQYLRDTFARDTARDMGAIDGHATLVHLYLNGLYWGLYNPVERPDSQMAEEYFGGTDEDYDALNRRTSTNEVIDGDMVRYNEMIDLANAALAAGVTTDEDYAMLQQYVAMDDFIDWFLRNQYVTNRDGLTAFDGNNQRAIGSRVGDPQFRFFVWDMEYSMWNATDNNNIAPGMNSPALAGSQNPPRSAWTVYNALRQHPEFRLYYGDRVQKHLFNDGALTPQAAADRWEVRANSIYTAIIGESARWGDAKRSTPYTRDVEWQAERNRLLTQYFPRRTDVLIGQLRTAGLYPDVAAPTFAQHGGDIPTGFVLDMESPSGTIYYTRDGSDPRLPDGSVSPTALARQPAAEPAVFIPQGAMWKYLDDGSDQGSAWYATDFVDASWAFGPAKLGYGENDIATEVDDGGDPFSRHMTTYFRNTLQIADASRISSLTLKLLRDDGAIVYLNGQEVARSNMDDGPFDYQTPAQSSVYGDAETIWHEYTVDPALLQDGPNVVAVELHQRSATSGDLSFDLELGSDDIIEPSPIVLDGTSVIRARALDGGDWSALNEARFVVGQAASAENLVVSELYYHPRELTQAEIDAGVDDNDAFEFIELLNTSNATVDLAGVRFTDGITFDFGESAVVELDPGESAVIARDLTAFPIRHGDMVQPVGQYEGGLKNGGEQIVLVGHDEEPIVDFIFDDSGKWPGRADGTGASLELIAPESVPLSEPDRAIYLNDPTHWRSGSEFGGSPGQVGIGPVLDIVVNEVLSHTDSPDHDSIELHNATDQAVDVGGWYLSDSRGDFRKFRIPDATQIAAGGYVVFDERDFNPTPSAPLANHFALDGAHGDDVWLLEADEMDRLVRFIDRVEFGAARNGESFGRWPDAAAPLVPMKEVTLDAINTGPRVGPIVIGEVQYNPEETVGPDPFEFVEIVNTSTVTVELADWRLRGGIDFEFLEVTELAPGDVLVAVSFDPTNVDKLSAFRDYYTIGAGVEIVGPFVGNLDNGGETIRIERPDESPPAEPEFIPRLLEDEVIYDDDLPWPVAADGHGQSLHRQGAGLWGNDAASWLALAPTPGSTDIGSPSHHPGDANLDGVTDVRDFMIWNVNKFTEGTTWEQGDFDLNGVTDVRDFMIWNVHKFTSAPAPAPVLTQAVDNVLDNLWQLDGPAADVADRTSCNGTWAEESVDKLLASYWP